MEFAHILVRAFAAIDGVVVLALVRQHDEAFAVCSVVQRHPFCVRGEVTGTDLVDRGTLLAAVGFG